MICPVVSKEHFRSMRITLAFSVIALSFCIAFAVLTFAGILAQYTALCAAFFALVSSGLFLLYRFSRDISLRKLELTESEIRVFGKTGKLLKTFPYSAVRELRVVTLMVGNFGGMYGKLKPENFICLSLDGQIPAPETRLTELYGSLDCLTFAYTKEAMTFLNQKFRRQFDANYRCKVRFVKTNGSDSFENPSVRIAIIKTVPARTRGIHKTVSSHSSMNDCSCSCVLFCYLIR